METPATSSENRFEVSMLRALLALSFGLTLWSLAASPGPAQPPPGPIPPPSFSPPPGVTYYSGPGVVYLGSPKHAFYAATPLPATVYPSDYGYSVGPVATYVGFGVF